MTDWFRNKQWDDEVQQAFEGKVARARDKGQYLTIQAFELLASRPDVAAALCRRAIDLDEPQTSAKAGLYLGTALAAQGDMDAAIAALEDAIAAQERHPTHRTGAYLDLALLIALDRREADYPRALGLIAEEGAMAVEDLWLTPLIALALLRQQTGLDGAAHAAAALEELEAMKAEGLDLPRHLLIANVEERLRACVEAP